MKILKVSIYALFLCNVMAYSSQGDKFLDRAAQKIVAGREKLPPTLPECADLFERAVSPQRQEDSELVRRKKELAKGLFSKLKVVPENEQKKTYSDLEWVFVAFQYRITRWIALKKVNSEMDKYEQELKDQELKKQSSKRS